MQPNTCKACGESGSGFYCARCGQAYDQKRISLSGLLRDLLHFITNMEKGFGYTVRELIVSPGTMQRSFLEGNRLRYQKPLSMFFISASVAAAVRYWILRASVAGQHAEIASEAYFNQHYLVLTYAVLVPAYTLFTWIAFHRSGYHYAELGVVMLYTVSIFFLASCLVFLLKIPWPGFDLRIIELPLYGSYMAVTMVRFFQNMARWQVIAKSILVLLLAFIINDAAEEFVIALVGR
jgi:hypothetical protein